MNNEQRGAAFGGDGELFARLDAIRCTEKTCAIGSETSERDGTRTRNHRIDSRDGTSGIAQ